jgi:two-component system LytT family sensor kinase
MINRLALLKNEKFKFKPHLIFWTIFVIYELAISYSFSGFFSSWIDYVTFYPLNIMLFYLHALIVFRNSTGNTMSYIRVGLLTLAEILLYLLIKQGITSFYILTGIYTGNHPEPLSKFLINSSWRAIYFIGLSSAYAFGNITIRAQKRIALLDKIAIENLLNREALEKNLLASENAYLKAQVNPHFIFNMLTFIHGNVVKHSEQLGDVVIMLADLMRYALTKTSEDGMVPLDTELENINLYITLNKYRFNHQICILINVFGETTGYRIIPLLLLTIIENIFKYGEIADQTQPAEIRVLVTDGKLNLEVFNKKISRPDTFSNGIGMTNVQKRLDQHYFKKHDLKVEQDDSYYKLLLSIDLRPDMVSKKSY